MSLSVPGISFVTSSSRPFQLIRLNRSQVRRISLVEIDVFDRAPVPHLLNVVLEPHPTWCKRFTETPWVSSYERVFILRIKTQSRVCYLTPLYFDSVNDNPVPGNSTDYWAVLYLSF